MINSQLYLLKKYVIKAHYFPRIHKKQKMAKNIKNKLLNKMYNKIISVSHPKPTSNIVFM